MSKVRLDEVLFHILLSFPKSGKLRIVEYFKKYYPTIKKTVVFETVEMNLVCGTVSINRDAKYSINQNGLNYLQKIIELDHQGKHKFEAIKNILLLDQEITAGEFEKRIARYGKEVKKNDS